MNVEVLGVPKNISKLVKEKYEELLRVNNIHADYDENLSEEIFYNLNRATFGYLGNIFPTLAIRIFNDYYHVIFFYNFDDVVKCVSDPPIDIFNENKYIDVKPIPNYVIIEQMNLK